MAKFHVSNITGQYGKCKVDDCAVADAENHFEKVNDAIKLSERMLAEKFKDLREKGRNTVWERPTNSGGDSY